ncbi:MAG: YcxB family protein [Saprospiraceae bacterium]|nr:YcxB family protein [Saprospiraceae bacterium]
MEPIKLEFTLEMKSYIRLMQRVMAKRLSLWGIIIGAILLLNIAINPASGAAWLIVGAVFLAVWYFLFRFMLQRAFKAAKNLHEPIRYIVDETEVRIETANSQATHAWSAFERTSELPEWFLLYQNKIIFNPIPKSAFRTASEMERFRALLKEKVK